MGPGKRADPQAFYPAEMNMRAQRARSLARFAGPCAPCIAFRMEATLDRARPCCALARAWVDVAVTAVALTRPCRAGDGARN
jgi:hypothetical protein